jgi:hypothetical protein
MSSNREAMANAISRYWETFQRKSPAEKAERTLNPGDGLTK